MLLLLMMSRANHTLHTLLDDHRGVEVGDVEPIVNCPVESNRREDGPNRFGGHHKRRRKASERTSCTTYTRADRTHIKVLCFLRLSISFPVLSILLTSHLLRLDIITYQTCNCTNTFLVPTVSQVSEREYQ